MQTDFGLKESDLSEINKFIKAFPEIEQVLIFGSRAKGNFKHGSDIDLALLGKKLKIETSLKLSYLLNEETNMPYQFDILNFHTISEPALIQHINRVGIKIYPR